MFDQRLFLFKIAHSIQARVSIESSLSSSPLLVEYVADWIEW